LEKTRTRRREKGGEEEKGPGKQLPARTLLKPAADLSSGELKKHEANYSWGRKRTEQLVGGAGEARQEGGRGDGRQRRSIDDAGARKKMCFYGRRLQKKRQEGSNNVARRKK